VLLTRCQSTFQPKFGNFFLFSLSFEELKGPFKVYSFSCLIFLEAKPQIFLLLWSLKGIDLQTLICFKISKTNNMVVLETTLGTNTFKAAKLDLAKSVLD